MKKLTLISSSVAIAIFGATAIAGAVENNEVARPHRGRHHMMQKLTEIGVTDAQKEQIRGIMRESRPTVQPLAKQMRHERRALRDAIQASPVNEPAIRAQAARVAQVQAELAVKRAYVADRIRAVLTPEQVAKFKELAAKRGARFEHRADRPKDT